MYQRDGLLRGGIWRQAFDDFDEMILGIESLVAAVGQQGVDEKVVNFGFYIAEGYSIFHVELGGVDHVLDEVSVDF